MARLTPPKSPIVYDKHHSGCMWSLYSLFEFRQGNSSRKLLSDRKRFGRDIEDGNVRPRDLVTKLDPKCQGKQEKNENSGNPDRSKETKSMRSVSGKATKPSQHPSHATLHGQKQLSQTNLVAKSADKLESAASSDTSGRRKHAKKKRGCGCKNVDLVKYDQLLKVNDVAEAIVNQKLIEGKYLSRDGVNQQSKQLLDALDILNSNKDLFTKLLQDPNSLLVKHIQDLRESQEQRQRAISSSEAKPSESQTCDDKCPSKGSRDAEPSEIVVLKPGSLSTQNVYREIGLGFEENVQRVRPTYFSFGDIKKKFRHAMGVTRKDPNLMLNDGTAELRSSPGEVRGAEEVRRKFQDAVRVGNKVTEFSSFDNQKRDKIEKLREFKARIGKETASSSESGHRRSESRMYMEDGSITNKNNSNFFQKQASNKLLEREISSPEYDFLPLHSPGRDLRTGFVTSQMRFSPYSYGQVSYDHWRLTREQKSSYVGSLKQNIQDLIDSKKSYSQSHVADTDLSSHSTVHEADRKARGDTYPMDVCSRLDDLEKNGFTNTSDDGNSREAIPLSKTSSGETTDRMFSEETNVLEVAHTNTNQSNDTKHANEETEDFECSEMDSSVDDQPSSSSSDVFLSTPSSVQRADSCDGCKSTGESSPISVLEQFFTDVSSPQSTTGQSEEDQSSTTPAKPRLDPETNPNASYIYGTISEYVKTVIQTSSLNSDDLILTCRESDQILEAVTSKPNQFCDECKLLFDCIIEVLVEVQDMRLRPSTWLSFIKPRSLQPFQAEKFVTQEAMKRIGYYIKPESTQQPLDHLIGNDLKRSRAWLDIQTDGEDVVCEIAEAAFEELVMETIVDLHI